MKERLFNIFVVGKTFIVNKLKHILRGGKVFSYMLSHDTKAREIFGHSYMGDDGELRHKVEMSIVDASIVILDELFKATSTLLNGMLGALSQNRNVFIDGVGEVKLPLISAFATSNEFPRDEVLDPFDDRLHFRYVVERIKDDKSFKRMILKEYDTTNEFSVSFSYEEIIALEKEYSKVKFVDEVLEFFVKLKNAIVRNELNISDRKLDDASSIFKASAYLNGRDSVNYSDIFVMMHLGWRDLTEKKKLTQIIFDTFFQKKEDLEKNLIGYKERLHQILSYAQAHVNPFLNDKIKFDLDDNNERARYNNYVNFYISVLEALEAFRIELEAAQNFYYFAMEVEDLIEENIFLINYKNSSFSEKYLVEYFEVNKEFEKTYETMFRYADEKGRKLKFIN